MSCMSMPSEVQFGSDAREYTGASVIGNFCTRHVLGTSISYVRVTGKYESSEKKVKIKYWVGEKHV
jgi:hypothetical protein